MKSFFANRLGLDFRKMQFRAFFLEGIFIAGLLAANVMAFKLMSVWGWVVSAGTLAYPITFLMTDALGDVFGAKRANRLVWVGFFAQVVFLLLILIGRFVPYPSFFKEGQEVYIKAFAALPRIVLGSMTAYLLSQLHDVRAFHFWKRKTNGRYLWIRNNASTMVSQLIDSAVFTTIVFVGTVPMNVFFQMMALQYIIKWIIAALDTPFCYLLVSFLKKGEKE